MERKKVHVQTYSIKDLETITGIKAHTIRIWESRYNLFIPERTPTNIRYYSDDDLKKLLNISMLISQGDKISKLASLSAEELNARIGSSAAVNQYDSIIERLILAMIGFERINFEDQLNEVIQEMGFEDAASKVIYPFFKKVGLLWSIDSINPAQEHFVTNIIKQKFFSAIDSLSFTVPSARTFLLFLPEREQHELGLLLAYYLIRKNGHTGIYLGQNMPLEDVIKTRNSMSADYLVTHLTSLMEIKEKLDYLKKLTSLLPGVKILVSGQQIENISGVPIRQVKYLKSPADLIKILRTISVKG